jgi:hypothetical protein
MSDIIITINKCYEKIVNKLLEYDYEDAKSVIELGIYNLNLLKRYTNLNREENIGENESFKTELLNNKIELEKLKREKDDMIENLKRERDEMIEKERKIKDEMIEKERRIKDEMIENIKRDKYESIERERVEKDELYNKIYSINKEVYNEKEKIRKEIETHYIQEIYEYKTELKNKEIQIIRMLETFEKVKNDYMNDRLESINKEIERLKEENEYYKKLYVDKSKGAFYEKELLPLLEVYNNDKLNNKWRIIHVGSSCSEKCDYQFRNKDTGEIILIDTKNNENHKPVPNKDIEKFIKDVTMGENSAIGGILIANSNITNKKNFEMNIVSNKNLVYISNFTFDNVEFIFTMLDMICENTKTLNNKIDLNSLSIDYINQYNFLTERLRNIHSEKKKYDNEISLLKSKYYTLFNDDIEVKTKGLENKENKKNVITNEIINFDEIEKGCKVIRCKMKGIEQRTKFYVKYNDNGENVVQYFAKSVSRDKKIEKLQENNIIEIET